MTVIGSPIPPAWDELVPLASAENWRKGEKPEAEWRRGHRNRDQTLIGPVCIIMICCSE